jgi:heat shock protein HtpX
MTQRLSFQDQISNNKLKSWILIITVFIAFIVLGYIIALVLDPSYFFIVMIFSTIFSLSYILISYYNSDKIAIASVKAKPASESEFPQFHHIVEGLSIASGVPKPRLYIMHSPEINAFASGRDHKNAVICVTTGCLQKLNKQELEGVMAHEMSHIANFDIRFMTLTAVLVGMISIIAQIYLRSLWFSSLSGRRDSKQGAILLLISVVAAILAPIFAQLVSLAISRKREFTADATAVKFTRYSPGLTSALKKIKSEHLSPKEAKEVKATHSKALAPLFISDPFKSKVQNLFSTHPPVDERISRLERM